jgi:hypothetical protein
MLTIRKLFCAIVVITAAISAQAGPVAVPNYSFEQPPVPEGTPAYPVHVAWQQTPKRADYVENPPFTWNVLTGVFPNTDTNSTDRIDNMDGDQAAYLFSERENGIFQQLDATFATGTSYKLTVGIVNSPNIPPFVGATLAISLYYTNATGDIVTVATTTVTYDTNTFPKGTHLVDFSVKAPAVQNSDPSIGKNIGILIKSTVTDQLAGGVWDLDNVRLVAIHEFVQVSNFSFENPAVPSDTPAYPFFNNWQKFPKPAYWDETSMGPWDNLTGVFPNPAADQPGHIDNVERAQAAYLFATPGNGFFQDLPTKYELNATYTVTAAIIGSTAIPPTNNTPITIALYYRDGQSNMVTVATKTVEFTAQNFPNPTNMVDISANSHAVVPPAPWLNKNIGVYVASAAGFDTAGGVWDVDNIRIKVSHGVALRLAQEGTSLRIAWDSEPGVEYQVLTAPSVSSSILEYAFVPYGNVLTGTGGELSVVAPISDRIAFFEVRSPITP